MCKIPGRARNTPFRVWKALTTHTISLPPTYSDFIWSQRAFGFRGFLFFLLRHITWSWKSASAKYPRPVSRNFSFSIHYNIKYLWVHPSKISNYSQLFIKFDYVIDFPMFCAIKSLRLKVKRRRIFDASVSSKTKGSDDIFKWMVIFWIKSNT